MAMLGNKPDLFSSKFRTYVLNDFSPVVKAKFYILDCPDDTYPRKYTLIGILPVQINPTNISGNYALSKDPNGGRLTEKSLTEDTTVASSGGARGDDGSMNISLVFDVYDEYNAATSGGALGALSSISLDSPNNEITSLWALRTCLSKHVLFMWGDIHYFGKLDRVSAEYTCFSPFGQPLKATANVEIKHEYVDGIIYNSSKDALAQAQKDPYDEVMKVLTTEGGHGSADFGTTLETLGVTAGLVALKALR
jgi:hypothetical protein